MSLDTAKKILKVAGIIMIIGGLVSIVMGISISFIGGYAGAEMPEAQTNPDYQKAALVMMGGGLFTAFAGIASIVEGIVAIMASKNNRYGTAAWILALIGLITSLLSAFNTIQKSGFNATNIVSLLIGLAISCLIYMAANKVRLVHKADIA